MNPLDDNISNWKTDPAAVAAGFFNPTNTVTAPWATLGNHASANGFDFYYGNNITFHGDALIARFTRGDIRAVDTTTGTQISIVEGLFHPLSVLRVPGGVLMADSYDIRFLHFLGDPVPEPSTFLPLLVGVTVAALIARSRDATTGPQSGEALRSHVFDVGTRIIRSRSRIP
jgi:hypothetical protein